MNRRRKINQFRDLKKNEHRLLGIPANRCSILRVEIILGFKDNREDFQLCFCFVLSRYPLFPCFPLLSSSYMASKAYSHYKKLALLRKNPYTVAQTLSKNFLRFDEALEKEHEHSHTLQSLKQTRPRANLATNKERSAAESISSI